MAISNGQNYHAHIAPFEYIKDRIHKRTDHTKWMQYYLDNKETLDTILREINQ